MSTRALRRAAERQAVKDARLTANQANAQLSTGPKTPEGKAKSCLNAVKTGLTAAPSCFQPTMWRSTRSTFKYSSTNINPSVRVNLSSSKPLPITPGASTASSYSNTRYTPTASRNSLSIRRSWRNASRLHADAYVSALRKAVPQSPDSGNAPPPQSRKRHRRTPPHAIRTSKKERLRAKQSAAKPSTIGFEFSEPEFEWVDQADLTAQIAPHHPAMSAAEPRA